MSEEQKKEFRICSGLHRQYIFKLLDTVEKTEENNNISCMKK